MATDAAGGGDEPDVQKSIIRREQTADGWIAYEPASSDDVQGEGPTQWAAVIDYVARVAPDEAEVGHGD